MSRPNTRAPFWTGFLAGALTLGLLGGGFAYAAGTTLFSAKIGTVNGVPITESQMLWYLLQRDSVDTVKNLVLHAIVAGQASQLGVTVTPAEVEEKLADYPPEQLATIGGSLDMAEVKAAIARQLTAAKVLDAKHAEFARDPQYAVTEDEILDFYLRHADAMAIPERVRLSIMHTTSLKSAEDALAALEGGTVFADVARQYSEDPATAENGGVIDRPVARGFFRGPLRKLDEAAFELAVGAHSPVISAADQHFIIQVDEKLPAHDVTAEEARPLIKGDLEDARIAPVMQDWVQSLGDTAQLDITYPVFSIPEDEMRNLQTPDDE